MQNMCQGRLDKEDNEFSLEKIDCDSQVEWFRSIHPYESQVHYEFKSIDIDLILIKNGNYLLFTYNSIKFNFHTIKSGKIYF